MPDLTNRTPIQAAWISFAESVQSLLSPQPDDRPLDQYLAFRDRVMALVQSDAFVNGLAFPARPDADSSLRLVDDALLAELQAFSRAAEVARTIEPTGPDRKEWLRRLLGRAGTVSGSVKDLLENLPPMAKSGITLFKELVDLFKGRDADGST